MCLLSNFVVVPNAYDTCFEIIIRILEFSVLTTDQLIKTLGKDDDITSCKDIFYKAAPLYHTVISPHLFFYITSICNPS